MKNETFEALIRATSFLSVSLHDILEKKLEVKRAARVGAVLFYTGASPGSMLLQQLGQYILQNQQKDGGWCDVEETMWALAYLKHYKDKYDEQLSKGLTWLQSERHKNGGWGYSSRDLSRLPLTGLMIHLLPEMADEKAISWLNEAATHELNNQPVLTYKLAIPLLAVSRHASLLRNKDNRQKLLACLLSEQNNDGGFGPWKGHPVGSEPWSTAFAMLCLCAYLPGSPALQKAVNWLVKQQLPDGSWAYHYLDEGSSLACWALAEALPLITDNNSRDVN